MAVLAVLCCLVPLLALAAVIFLGAPSVPVFLAGSLLLAPLARALLRAAWAGDRPGD